MSTDTPPSTVPGPRFPAPHAQRRGKQESVLYLAPETFVTQPRPSSRTGGSPFYLFFDFENHIHTVIDAPTHPAAILMPNFS